MKRIYTIILLTFLTSLGIKAQGWPSQYQGVMLQGFYWDSFDETNWTVLEKQADELAQYFKLVWLPQSGNCNGLSMGYDDVYWFPGGTNYTSSFGTESELRSLIKTFKSKGIGTIADVVINHRKPLSGSFGFPTETYNGVTYQMTQADVVKGDGGTGQADTGEGWNGMPDLDHNSTNVQTIVKAYLRMLLNDLGYAGFRYDMVKGYSGSFTGIYNAYANPTYSVGEYWDGNAATVKKWIDATKVNNAPQSAAFDFAFRYSVRNALRGSSSDGNSKNWKQDANWSLLRDNSYPSIMSDKNYRRYAITFIENHDTEKRSNADQDPIRADTLAGNAYLLAMPGTPCVFFKHWIDCKQQIKPMIELRNMVGIHNESTYAYRTNTAYSTVLATEVQGTKGKLLVVVGNTSLYTPSSTAWVKAISGKNYAYYLEPSMEIAWVDLPSGNYEAKQKATLTAISADANAKLVYTTDGTTPTASSKQATSGTQIDIPAETTTTLKVGLLTNGTVKSIVTRQYVIKKTEEEVFSIPAFCTRTTDEVCAFFEAPNTWTGTIGCWAWSDSPADNFTYAQRKGWPGVDCTLVGTTDSGKKVWKWTWDGSKEKNTSVKQPTKIIFNNISGNSSSAQTADLIFVNGAYYRDKDGKNMGTVTATGIADITIGNTATTYKVFTTDGRLVRTTNSRSEATNGLRPGLYIINKQKVFIR